MRRVAVTGFTVVAAVCLLATSACSVGGPESGDPLQVVENPVPATAARSPVPETEPAGTVLPVEGKVTALRADEASGTLAVATTDSPAVLLYDLADPRAGPRATTAVPGEVTDFTFTEKYLLASVPSASTIVRIPLQHPDAAERIAVRGEPTATARLNSHTLVAVNNPNEVRLRTRDGTVESFSGNLYSADDVLVAGGEAFVLDRVRTALFRLDLDASEVGAGLRAGLGATNAVVDRYGRILVTDTRGNSLLAFSTDPFMLRQRYPVPGGIFAIAYDAERNLAWVTLTKRNEVVAFDMGGGAPVEKYRFPTVRQPNSVAVDARTGRVFIGSATGEGLQVITP